MTRRRLWIYVSFWIKHAIAGLFIAFGGLLGIVGIGPDGMIPFHDRVALLCLLFGGLGLAYPFAVVPRQGVLGWIAIGIAISSLCLGLMASYLQAPSDLLTLVILGTMSLSATAAAITNRVLSRSPCAVLPNVPQPQSRSPQDSANCGSVID